MKLGRLSECKCKGFFQPPPKLLPLDPHGTLPPRVLEEAVVLLPTQPVGSTIWRFSAAVRIGALLWRGTCAAGLVTALNLSLLWSAEEAQPPSPAPAATVKSAAPKPNLPAPEAPPPTTATIRMVITPGGGAANTVATGTNGTATVSFVGVAASSSANVRPAPDLLPSSAALDQQVDGLIAQVDSPSQTAAARALEALIALDGAAVDRINRVLAEGGLTLNLQHQLRQALSVIAVKIPDSTRQMLLAERQREQAERAAQIKKWLGRNEAPTGAEVLKLDAIPHTLDQVGAEAILRLPGQWPSRFFEKFLMAGGMFDELNAAFPETEEGNGQAAWARRQAMIAMQMQRGMNQGENPYGPTVGALLEGPQAARAGISTAFLLRWKAAMDRQNAQPANRALAADLLANLLNRRSDPEALAWAREVLHASVGVGDPSALGADHPSAPEGPQAAPVALPADPNDDLPASKQLQLRMIGRSIEMLERGGQARDVTFLRELAFRPGYFGRWLAFNALRMHWTAADVPQLCETIRTSEKTPESGYGLIEMVAALEDPRLDAALAEREDLFKSDELQYALVNCVLARATPPLVEAAQKAWIHEGKVQANAQALVVRLELKQYYPALLEEIFDVTNQRLQWDVSPTVAYSLMISDPGLVKPYLYAIDDLIANNRSAYQETRLYSKTLFDALREKFKDNKNQNEMYLRARLVADARLLLAAAGDKEMEARVAATIKTFVGNNNARRLEFDQVLMMWYGRLLPQYPLAALKSALTQVNPRFLDSNGSASAAYLCDPAVLRAQLLGDRNRAAAWYRRNQRLQLEMGNNPGMVPQGMDQNGGVPLYSDYLYRVQLALQYRVPELVLEALQAHPNDFKDQEGLLATAASSFNDVGQYAAGAQILEARVADEHDGANLQNNLAWLYATALDPVWCKADRAVALSERSVRLAPAMGYSLDTRAYARLVAGRYEDALADFEASYRLTALADHDGMASSLARQARALHYLKRDDEALARLALAVRLNPADPETKLWIARGYGLLGRTDDALRLLAQCEAAGYMYHEVLQLTHDFDGLRKERLYSEIIDNMKRHRQLVRDILVEATPVSELPLEEARAGEADSGEVVDILQNDLE